MSARSCLVKVDDNDNDNSLLGSSPLLSDTDILLKKNLISFEKNKNPGRGSTRFGNLKIANTTQRRKIENPVNERNQKERRTKEERRRKGNRIFYLWAANGQILMKGIERSGLYLSVKSTVENPERIAMIREIFGFPRHGCDNTCPKYLPRDNQKVEILEYFAKI